MIVERPKKVNGRARHSGALVGFQNHNTLQSCPGHDYIAQRSQLLDCAVRRLEIRLVYKRLYGVSRPRLHRPWPWAAAPEAVR